VAQVITEHDRTDENITEQTGEDTTEIKEQNIIEQKGWELFNVSHVNFRLKRVN
jgi:hypothetical protein